MAAGDCHGQRRRTRSQRLDRQAPLDERLDAHVRHRSTLLGPRLTADTGEWGTFSWSEHVLGAPGYRIAGGSDEIQRNIIAERVLGLPAEARVDREVPWRDVER